ncbi:hypothetical protein I5907_14725 [Panacibacter sp. DH6]|uniref:Uncharacterized protein n=1 Tax=Panacibacter microcysteis TaxID=2793269 RepID=A0A931E8U8_9BACT|nr:hypothetical protein [Panacibacter microcysteis]MBG9377496.1 hypothetical protein [Panacibacter microcysteis]
MPGKLTYNNNGRGGTVVYSDAISEISFDFEFGGGNCVAIIFIPAEQHWCASTQRTLDERAAIIDFVAKQSLADQVSGGYYEVWDNYIELYKK